MRWIFKTREQVESFLVEEFPEFPPQQVLSAFEWAFFEGSYETTDSKTVWAKRLTELRNSARRSSPDEASDLFAQAELEEIWHANYPKTGGRDPADYILADWVKMAFEDLGATISFGISADPRNDGVEPSTRFGRVVRAVLDWRRSHANWRRPAQASAHKSGPLS
ncbi:MAG: hypothetical protein EP320_11055 [Rhodobacteraceae bacterium]|nr:MAG: hypothetical protein EP320_11055 [Paracoccaceae bacterium]